MVSNAVCMSVR